MRKRGHTNRWSSRERKRRKRMPMHGRSQAEHYENAVRKRVPRHEKREDHG